MILKIILLLAASFAIFWAIKTKKVFPAIITAGLVLGIVLTFVLPPTLAIYGIYLYLAFVLLSLVYAFTVKRKKIWPRLVIALMAAFIIVYWLWVLNHWHGNELLAPIVVVIVGLAGIISKAKLRNELGFLIILAADAVALIIEHLMKVWG